jgi:CheY-like chemotaxis protein
MARILLVEDDEFISRMVSMRLGLLEHEVEHAVNGQEAVDMALATDYDLVLMDMHMPVMDGHEATRRLREQGYKGLIVAVTASVMSADSEKAIKSGCDDCIPKPIGDDFEERISTLLK